VSGVFGHGVSKCEMNDEKIRFKGGDERGRKVQVEKE
jgi:hypothetical protein